MKTSQPYKRPIIMQGPYSDRLTSPSAYPKNERNVDGSKSRQNKDS